MRNFFYSVQDNDIKYFDSQKEALFHNNQNWRKGMKCSGVVQIKVNYNNVVSYETIGINLEATALNLLLDVENTIK